MKPFFILFICLLSITALCSDTTNHFSKNEFSEEERWEQRKRRLDSKLKETDAIMDSLAGNPGGRMDTFIILKNYELQKKREAEARVYLWVKVGSLLFLLILGVGFWAWKKWKAR